jgi:hypothetical protein
MLLQQWWAGRNWRYQLAAVALFGLAGWATYAAIKMGLKAVQCPETACQMAYYGDAVRSNLLHLENSLEAWRSDGATWNAAESYAARTQPDQGPITYFSKEHGRYIKAMYLQMVRFHTYNWLTAFPAFYLSALRGLDNDADFFHGVDRVNLREHQIPWVCGPHYAALAALQDVLPYVVLLESVFLLLASAEPIRAGSFLVYSGFYAAVLLAVLPESKHVGPLVVPLTVIGGLALARILVPGALRISRARIKWVCLLLGGCALAWGAARAVAYLDTVSVRDQYLSAVLDLAAHGTAAPQTIKDPQNFAVTFPPGKADIRTGFLLKIRAGREPGALTCVRNSFYESQTEHRLHPGREQYFFVSCLEVRDTDPVPEYRIEVKLTGEAKILSCTRVDLAGWQKLPLCTVFYEGQRCPGSPSLPHN